VTLPIIRPGVIAAAMFSFIASFSDLEKSLFLVGPGKTTLPIAIVNYLEWSLDSTIAAVATVQILIIGAALLLSDRYVKLGKGVLKPMAGVTLARIGKSYGDFTAVSSLDLTSARASCSRLLGPSGCGKTTTLRMIAGFVAPHRRARSRSAERDVTALPAHQRNVGMVFQSYALFPHLTVVENVAFGLRVRGVAAERERTQRASEALTLRAARGASPSASPRALSGGQQQRVALARAHRRSSRAVLLLDEPLSRAGRASCASRCSIELAPSCSGSLGITIGLRHARPGRGDDHAPTASAS
jgi:ABC-type thiamine transport system ATPase subunit